MHILGDSGDVIKKAVKVFGEDDILGIIQKSIREN